MRRLVTYVLAMFAFGSAIAAPIEYEFRAFVGTQEAQGSPAIPPFLSPSTELVGTLSFDPARTANGANSPVVALRLRTRDGVEVFNAQPDASSLETRSQIGLETVIIRANFDIPERFARGTFVMSWASTGHGQLPADPQALNLLALQPYGWKITISRTPKVCNPCGFSRIDAQVYNFKRAAAAAEYEQNFGSAPSRWANSGGDWPTQSGYYANAANVAFTSSVYTGQTLQPFVEVRADLYSGFTSSGNALGLVFNYQNASNFNEVRFTANGVVTINKVVNGARSMLQTGSYSVPPKTFFHVSVLRDFDRIEVRVNADPAITADDFTLQGGRAGVFASWNRARFDNFAIDQLSSWTSGFLTDFSSSEQPFEARTGTWVTENGVYRNTSSQAAAISTVGFPRFIGDFALYARMNMAWVNSANRGGLVWDFRDPRNYSAVLVSPRTTNRPGTIEVVEVVNGVSRVLIRGSDAQLRAGQWGEVSVSRIDGVVRVSTTGTIAPYLTVAQQGTGGQVGVISSWNMVSFDDVVFRTQTGPN